MNTFFNNGVFVKGRKYTCIYNDQRDFTHGKEYECLGFEGTYNSNLMKDGSTVKFMSDKGNVNTLFGSIAVGCFTDDKVKIVDKFSERAQSYHEYSLKEYRDFSEKLESALRELQTLNTYIKTHNTYCELLGREPEKLPSYDDEILLKDLIKKYDETFIPTDPVLKYIDSPAGLKLLRQYKIDEEGTWSVYINGVNKYYTGTLKSVIDVVTEIPDFKNEITKINIKQL